MEISFVKGYPALLVRKERVLVVGDLHIGRELRLSRSGIHLPNATERMADLLLSLAKKHKAKGIVLLGDVKDSLGNPMKEEYLELGSFFYRLRGIRLRIAKGNHDSRIEEIVKRLGAEVPVAKEILLDKVALVHGHAMPSDQAMLKSFVVTAHSHPAVNINGRMEKAWAVAGIGKGAGRSYKRYNRKAKLVIMPAFNELITGSELSREDKFTPLLRNKVFDSGSARMYDLSGREIEEGLY